MNHFVAVLLVGAAGAFGAIARYGTHVALTKVFGESFPLGTLVVNVVGCFCLGILAQLGDQYISNHWKLIIGVGFLGALTTFSTFGLETVTRINAGQMGVALLNVALNVVVGLGAVVLGMYMAESWTDAE